MKKIKKNSHTKNRMHSKGNEEGDCGRMNEKNVNKMKNNHKMKINITVYTLKVNRRTKKIEINTMILARNHCIVFIAYLPLN